MATRSKTHLIAVPSVKPTSKDRLVPYRVKDFDEITARLAGANLKRRSRSERGKCWKCNQRPRANCSAKSEKSPKMEFLWEQPRRNPATARDFRDAGKAIPQMVAGWAPSYVCIGLVPSSRDMLHCNIAAGLAHF